MELLKTDALAERWDHANQDFDENLVLMCPNPGCVTPNGDEHHRTG